MRWSFWVELRGPARLWAASLTFTFIGVIIVLIMPWMFVDTRDAVASVAMKLLGWTLLGLGLVILVPMVATLYIRRTQPEKVAVWHWWINFIGGLLGALAFAIPATLMLPIFLAAYLTRPNILFSTEPSEPSKNLGIAALFSVAGIAALFATLWLARLKLREEPKRE